MNIDTWKFINTFAPWLSAIGTFTAVIVSLYLARASKPLKLQICVGHRLIIDPEQAGKPPEYLYIKVVNISHRVATITNVGWRVGVFRKIYAIQKVPKDNLSSGLPAKIDDGEEAVWMIPLDISDNWIKRFSRDYLEPHPRWNLFWLRLQIHTSVDKTYETRIEKNLHDKLKEECKRLKSEKTI